MWAPSVHFKFHHAEFDRTLRQYIRYTERDLKTIVDTKGFYIARRATVETMKTPRERIEAFIGLEDGAVIGRLINKRRGKKGDPGLFGAAMRKAVAKVRAARLRSRAFLASGWIPAIKALEPYAEKRGAPRQDRAAKVKGQPKGYGQPAHGIGWSPKSVIANTAQARWDKGKAEGEGLKGLKAAFDFEVASMREYIIRKMSETARRAGIRTH